jgi:hypothetical protein
MYTGYSQLGFTGGIVHKGEVDECSGIICFICEMCSDCQENKCGDYSYCDFDYPDLIKCETGWWIYEYTPDEDTDAELLDGLPYRVGTYYVTGSYDNGRYVDVKNAVLEITPAPLTIDITFKQYTKVYDGTTSISIDTAELNGILADDIVYISNMGEAAYASSDAAAFIDVLLTDFEIGGDYTSNYYLIQPAGYTACITRAPYPGNISVVINDDPLRIGSLLTFTATSDPEDYHIQWRTDDVNIPGANGIAYTVMHWDVNKTISVALISSCMNYEGESPPTAYVPYTINLSISDDTEPMDGDYVYFGEPGNYTAYAASINDGFVDIHYILYDSGLDTDFITYSGAVINNVKNAGNGTSRYYAYPTNAVNGVINLEAAFYHMGADINPNNAHVFENLICAYDTKELHSITIKQLGNAPLGAVSIRVMSDYTDVFLSSSEGVSSIGIGDSHEFKLSVSLGNVPPDLEGYTFMATVEIEIEHIGIVAIPISVNIDHEFPELIYRGGFHDHECLGCGFYNRGDCDYSSWITVGDHHQRTCGTCHGVDLHENSWGDWGYGSESQHIRTCTLCTIIDSASHSWSLWGHGTATHHIRDCIICDRPDSNDHIWNPWDDIDDTLHRQTCVICERTEELDHVWSSWASINATHHRRTCTDCARIEDYEHIFGNWSNLNTTHHRRTCFDCGFNFDQAHTWGEWSSWGHGNNSQHIRTRSCTTPGCTAIENNGQNHSWSGWGNINSSLHRRNCSICSLIEEENHSWSSWSTSNASEHSRSCSLCGRSESQAHSMSNWSGWSQGTSQHSRSRSCWVCGRSETDSQSHSWSSWSNYSTSEHRRSCFDCGRSEGQSHSWSWSSWSSISTTQHSRSRTCSICNRSETESGNHTFGSWYNSSANNHRRACSVCNREEAQAHTWGNWSSWGTGTSSQHTRTRTCNTSGCGRVDTDNQNHSWGSWSNLNATQHRRTCNTCSRQDTVNHTWGNATSTNFNLVNNLWSGRAEHTRSCTQSGCNATIIQRCSTSLTWINVNSTRNGITAAAHCYPRCNVTGCTTGQPGSPHFQAPGPCTWNPYFHSTTMGTNVSHLQAGWQNYTYHMSGEYLTLWVNCARCGSTPRWGF